MVGEALLRHPGVDKVAFTGSTEVGRHAAAVSGENLTQVTMELGGNAANIVFADADVESAIGAAVKAFVFNTGQFCMGGPRLLVERPLYETVLGILAQAVPGVPLGDPRDVATVVGPLASARQREIVEGYVEQAKASGARVVCGGARPELPGDLADGFFYSPTVLADVKSTDPVVARRCSGPS